MLYVFIYKGREKNILSSNIVTYNLNSIPFYTKVNGQKEEKIGQFLLQRKSGMTDNTSTR